MFHLDRYNAFGQTAWIQFSPAPADWVSQIHRYRGPPMAVSLSVLFGKRKRFPYFVACILVVSFQFAVRSSGQSPPPYRNAATDRIVHPKTPMVPPAANEPFTDPDFGSRMVRATDETTDYVHSGSYLMTEGSGQQNEWSSDTKKFWVSATGGQIFAFAFNASTMKIASLAHAIQGRGLLLPLRTGATFSFVDPDLIYGTQNRAPLTINTYRFSTGESVPLINTTACGPTAGAGSEQ
jgi:hypothetical protein